MNKKEKVAVVTGAASGIGAAVVRRLAQDGFRVWAADLNEQGVQQLARELCESAMQVSPLALDVGSERSVGEAFERVRRASDHLDVLVNSAGIVAVSPFEQGTQEVWERVLRINVVGTYLCLQAALPALKRAEPPARVINLSSGAAKMPGPFTAAYNASKAAVLSLTRSAAVALAPGVLVNSVCPGVIGTPMWEKLGQELATAGAGPGTSFDDRIAALPIKRAGTAEDVANVISFLASGDSAYIVGEDVNVTGGYVMH